MSKYQLKYSTTCCSDYFSGSNLPVVQVLVDKHTTYQDIKDNLLEYQTYEHLYEDYKGIEEVYPEGFDSEEYKKAVIELFTLEHSSLDTIFDASLDSSVDDELYDCYIYFILEQEEN